MTIILKKIVVSDNCKYQNTTKLNEIEVKYFLILSFKCFKN